MAITRQEIEEMMDAVRQVLWDVYEKTKDEETKDGVRLSTKYPDIYRRLHRIQFSDFCVLSTMVKQAALLEKDEKTLTTHEKGLLKGIKTLWGFDIMGLLKSANIAQREGGSQ